MPELPEVETYKRYVDATSLHQTIDAVEVSREEVLEVAEHVLRERLIGQQFSGTRRRGKYLGLDVSSGDCLVLHFGLTGHVNYYKNEEEQSSYERVAFHFDNDYTFGFDNMRLFGEVYLMDSWEQFLQEKDIGPDAHDLAWEEFQDCLDGRRGMIKPTLMKQNILAGLGNIWVDEILLQAKIHPETKANQLDDDDRRRIYDIMIVALEKAIDIQADYSQLPEGYLLRKREEDVPCPNKCGTQLSKMRVSGRGTVYCTSCQVKV